MYTTYKKLTLFTVLPLTLLYAHAHASAPAPTRPVEKVSAQVWGDMYLVSSMKYLGEDPQDLLWGAKLKHILDDKHQPIALKSSDVTVDVWISSDDSEHWADHGHPILGRGAFPSCLPISMLEGKKEGEPLIFTLQCPMIKKICKVLLLCHGRNCEKFELQLNRLKESFNDELHYNCGDEERLLAQQIIVRNPAGTKLRELENALRNTPSLLWVHDEHEVRQICARRTQLQGAIAHIKTEWTKHHKLTAFGTIPEYIHGPNGFKLASAPTTQSDNAQPQAHQEQHSAQSTSSIAAQAHTLPSGRSATKPDEMD